MSMNDCLHRPGVSEPHTKLAGVVALGRPPAGTAPPCNTHAAHSASQARKITIIVKETKKM